MRIIEGEFQFLGTGASLGVPVIGCSCATCTSSLKENKRLRTAVTLSYHGKTLLIDAGTDFRHQALNYRIRGIDAFIVTHAHHDHTAGIDDLRAFFITRTVPIPTLMSKETHLDLKERYAYIFNNQKTLSIILETAAQDDEVMQDFESEQFLVGGDHSQKVKAPPTASSYGSKDCVNASSSTAVSRIIPQFNVEELKGERGECLFADLQINYFTYSQQGMKVTGLRSGDFAFVTDIKEFEETVIEDLQGVHTLVISALRKGSSNMHFTVDEAIAFSRKVGAKETYLTHMGHEIEYETLSQTLPEGVFLAYDGLKINVRLKGTVYG